MIFRFGLKCLPRQNMARNRGKAGTTLDEAAIVAVPRCPWDRAGSSRRRATDVYTGEESPTPFLIRKLGSQKSSGIAGIRILSSDKRACQTQTAEAATPTGFWNARRRSASVS